MNEKVIEKYQRDEKMMILIYAQWCVNHNLDPEALYHEAYPEQLKNEVLQEVILLTVDKEEADEIPDTTLLQVLQAFGNYDLAFIVQREITKRKK